MSPKRQRHRAPIESLETRTLFYTFPLAVPSEYTVLKDQPLVATIDRTYLTLNASPARTVEDTWFRASVENVSLLYNQGTTNGFVVQFGDHGSGMHGDFHFTLPKSVPVAPVSYTGIWEFGMPSGSGPNMYLSIGGHADREQMGNFTIHDVAVDDAGKLTRLAIEFGQYNYISGTFEYHMPANRHHLGYPLTLALASNPTHGSVSLAPDGSFTYTPSPGFTGTDSFTYTVSDIDGTSPPVTATLNVTTPNLAPSFTAGPNVTVPFSPGPQSIANWATNLSPGSSAVDMGQSLSFSLVANSNPSLFQNAPSIDSSGNLSFTPHYGRHGTATLTFLLRDDGGTDIGGQDTSATHTFDITVLPPLVNYSGRVFDVYAQPNGVKTTPLAAREVYVDANDNGRPDAGETTAYTNTAGVYELTLFAGAHTIRVVPRPGWITPAGYQAAAVTGGSSNDLYVTMANPVVIDVLAAHPDAMWSPDGVTPWESAVRDAFWAANWIFANSDTNVRLRLAGVSVVDYVPDADNVKVDLGRLRNPSDGVLDAIPKRRDALRADLAVLFRWQADAAGFAGVAAILDPARPDPSAAYAVVTADPDPWRSGIVLAHEIGHLLGADHDPANKPTTRVPYGHGHRFKVNDDVYRDVMAYAPGTQLPFFSNPRLTYGGKPLGNARTADVARLIRETAPLVASYRGAKVTPVDAIGVTSVKPATATAKRGTAFPITTSLRNNYVATFNGKVALAFYLSADQALDATDTLLARHTFQGLNIRGLATSSPNTTTLKLPAKVVPGKYFLLAVATTTGKPAHEYAAGPASAPLKVTAAKASSNPPAATRSHFQSTRPITADDDRREFQHSTGTLLALF